jgi:hypothetical protein
MTQNIANVFKCEVFRIINESYISVQPPKIELKGKCMKTPNKQNTTTY